MIVAACVVYFGRRKAVLTGSRANAFIVTAYDHARIEVVVSSTQIPESRMARLRELGLRVGYLNIRIESDPAMAGAKVIDDNPPPVSFDAKRKSLPLGSR